MFIKWFESSQKEHKYTFFYKVIGERYGDRLGMTYHRSVNTMNKEFQNDGDRLKEELRNQQGEKELYFLYDFPITNASCRSIEVNSYFYHFPMI